VCTNDLASGLDADATVIYVSVHVAGLAWL